MTNEVRLRIGAATDVGRERTVNEDAHGFLRCSAGDFVVVCDGMGGHAAGDVASRTARDAALAYVLTHGDLPPAVLLTEAAIAAHHAVRGVASQSEGRTGMGTTLVLALVREDLAWISNVGDSRCYHVRQGHRQQVSVDHTRARRLLDAGVIDVEDYVGHPEKGILSQALGQAEAPKPQISDPLELFEGDYLILCSDGAYEVTEPELAPLTAAANPSYAAHDLVARAVELDGRDNATAVIARFGALDNYPPSSLHSPKSQRGPFGPGPAILALLFLVIGLGSGLLLRPLLPDSAASPKRHRASEELSPRPQERSETQAGGSSAHYP